MAQLAHFDIRIFREELMCDPKFYEAFRQLELSKKPNTLVALLQDGTYIEYTCIPGMRGIKIENKKITRDEAIAQYYPACN